MSESTVGAGGTAAEYAASLEDPVLEIRGFHFAGRILSIEQWLPHWERRLALEELAAKAVECKTPPDLRPWLEHWVAFLKDVFPRKRYYFWAPDPVRLMREEPGLGLREHYERFFLYQAAALGAPLPPAMRGPNSNAATAATAPGA